MQRVSTVCSPRHRVAIAAFVAALALASPLLRAQRATAPAPAAPAATPTATLDRVRAAARIRLGYRDDARPFSYKDESGQPTGYAVALCQKIADAVKAEPGLGAVTVEWVPVTVETRLTAVQQGDIDLFCGPEPITLAARRDVSFSIPVFPGGVGAVLRADAPARLREALSGNTPTATPIWRGNAAQFLQARTYAVVAGTPTEQWLAGRTRELGIVAKVSTVTSNDAGVAAVVARDVRRLLRRALHPPGRRQAKWLGGRAAGARPDVHRRPAGARLPARRRRLQADRRLDAERPLQLRRDRQPVRVRLRRARREHADVFQVEHAAGVTSCGGARR